MSMSRLTSLGAATAWLVQLLMRVRKPRARQLLDLSDLVQSIAPSKTVAIFSQTSEMKSRGETVNGALCVGQPDFAPPPEALRATAEAADRGLTACARLGSELVLS